MTVSEFDKGLGTNVELYANNYPFVLPSGDVTNILADCYILYSAQASLIKPPLRITQLKHFGRVYGEESDPSPDEHFADVVITDANDSDVFDTSSSDFEFYMGGQFGDRFYVHQWVSTEKRIIIRILQHLYLRQEYRTVDTTYTNTRVTETSTDRVVQNGSTARQTEQPGGTILINLPVEAGVLDERTYELRPGYLSSIRLGDQRFQRSVVFRAGANITFSNKNVPTTTALTLPNAVTLSDLLSTITISAIDNAGALNNGCGSSAPSNIGLRTLNDVKPDDNGNINLSANECLYVTQPTYVGKPSTPAVGILQVGNQCKSCCSCQDYIDAYARIRATSDKMAVLLPQAELIRDEYTLIMNDVAEFTNILNDMPINVIGVGGTIDSGTNWSTTVTTAISVANTDIQNYTNVVLTINCTFPGAATAPAIYAPLIMIVDQDGIATPGTISGTWPTYTATWEAIDPGQSVKLQFTMCWSGADASSTALTGTCTICASAAADQGNIPLRSAAYTACRDIRIST